MLYIFSRNPEERQKFLAFLGPLDASGDEKVKVFCEECEQIVTEGDYLSFFYVLAAWRLFVGGLQGIGRKKELQSIWMLFFSSRKRRTDQEWMMQRLFRKSRQVVTSFIHSLMEIGPSTTANMDGLIDEMFHGEYIMGYSNGLAETDVSRHLEQLEALHLRVFFSSENANRRALQDMRASKQWWEGHLELSLKERISSLFYKPVDWPPVEDSIFVPFSRLFLPSAKPRSIWLQEVERWKDMGWKDGEFMISLVGRSGLICDIYMDRTRVDIPAISNAMQVMAYKLESWRGHEDRDSRQRMEASLTSFGVRLLERAGNGDGVVSVRPTSLSGREDCCLVTLAPSMRMAAADVRGVAGNVQDENRRRELDWFFQNGNSIISPVDNGELKAVMVFLGRVVLLADEIEITDLDIVIAEFYGRCIVWTICQLKDGTQTGGDRQLDRVRDYFPSLGEVERLANFGKTKCWIARIVQHS